MSNPARTLASGGDDTELSHICCRHISPDIRDNALGHALYALGDSALSHDGWLRPRVWELADQITRWIATGETP